MRKINIIPAALLLIVSFSCQKKNSCTCTTTLTHNGYLPHQTVTVQEISKTKSLKKANKICKNTAIQMQANTRLLYTDDVGVETSCALQVSN
jgi:hypothetical protein